MLSTMLRTIREQALFARGERVLVAISGGPDSTAMLDALRVVAPRLGLVLEAATVDHGLRPESGAEADLVVARCRALGISCERVAVDVRAVRARHVSWQDAARRARLAALEAVATRQGCASVALGHTADDQAETVLFRILRGTGVAGLAGIPYRRGRLVRPLLDVRRSEVLRLLARRRVPFIEDPSNADRRFARARLRHEWIPSLARENPRLVDALLALAADARRVAPGPAPAAPMGSLRAHVLGLSRRAAATVARLTAEGAGTRTVSVVGGDVEVSYGKVSLRPRSSSLGGAATPAQGAQGSPGGIDASGTYRVGSGCALEVTFAALEPAHATPEWEKQGATFDLDRVALPLGLRAPRPGDRMRPRGGRGSRKLSDLFIDAKIPRPRRAELPVLVAGDGTILFVPGLRPAEAGRPSGGTRRWIQVQPR
jgi:tRNA(Ile)-lysidine synthase